MAITIITSPGTHTPGYNHQYFVASGNNTAQPNFKYVCKTYIRGFDVGDLAGVDVLAATNKITKRPDNSWLYFNPQRIVESYVKNQIDLTTYDFTYSVADAEDRRSIQMVTQVIDEEYGSPVSGFSGATGVYYVWNGAYAGLDFADFTYSTTTVSKDLHLNPSNTDTIRFDQRYLFKSWHRGFSTRDLKVLQVKAYNSAGTLIQHTTFDNTYYNNTSGRFYNNYIASNCSPYSFNNFTANISYQLNVTDVIPTTTSYYTFYFEDAVANASSNVNTVYIDDWCSKYTPYVLHFLNRYGNFDSHTFNLVSRYTTEKESLNYKKLPYELNSSNKYTYAKTATDTIVYSTVLTNKRTLTSGWVTEAQAAWLRDLITSPDIRFEDSSATLVAVKCTEKSYETKIKAQDKLINIALTVEFDINDVRQRG